MKKNKPKFIRKESTKKSKLGYKRKKLLKWRRQKGKHSKIRQKMKGYTRRPCIGFRSEKKTRDLINNLKPILISNIRDLDKIKENQIAILKHTSIKNKTEIAKKAREKNIKIKNLSIEKFLEENKLKEKNNLNN